MPLRSPRSRDHLPRPRVYLSSTFNDLTECRASVRAALERLRIEVVAMEAYTAEALPPAEKCQSDVRACDLYLGIFAWSYGSTPNGESRSFTELEYREAEASGLPRLVFLLDEDASWPRRFVDRGDDQGHIERLREELGESLMCSFFTDSENLASLVTAAVSNWLREHQPEQADPVALALPEWDAYRRRLVQEYRRLDLEALTPPELEDYLQIELRNVFVEPEVRESVSRPELPKELWRKLQESAELSPADVPNGLAADRLAEVETHRQQIAQPVFQVLAGPGGHRCVLLGDPGSGKSTLARYLALSLAEGDLSDGLERLEGHQPLLIELREYALERAKYRTFGEYLDFRATSDGLGVPTEALDTYLEDGGALVVFDGLDELFDPRERQTISRQIAGFAEAHPRAQVVVTSRIIGYQPRVLGDAGFRHYTIEDLDRARIERFLESWYGLALRNRPTAAAQRRTRLTTAIEETPAIRDLAGNPLLLTILAIIGKHQELPRERSEVYNHAAGVLVHHWDVNKHLSDAQMSAAVIREEDKKELLRRLAYRMQRGKDGVAGNYIWNDELEAEILAFLQDRFEYPRHEARNIAQTMIGQLRVRNFVLVRYGPHVYGFVHRALLEYFCAAEVVARFEKTRELSEDDLCGIFADNWEDPSWTEVLRLIAGMVHPSVADTVIRHLLAESAPRRTAALERPALGTVALAFQCLAEVRALSGCKPAAGRAQRALIALLRLPNSHVGMAHGHFVAAKVLPAVRSVGSAWPGRWDYWEWFENEGRHVTTLPGAEAAARIAAAVLSDRPEVRERLVALASESPIDIQRSGCLKALSETWPGEERVRVLALRLLRDPSQNVRATAITVLAEHFAADGAVRTAVHAMRDDQWAMVQNAALQALATRWTEHPDTLRALTEALSSPMTRTRVAILDLATARFGDHDVIHTAVLTALRDCDWHVRRAALGALVSQWTDTPETRVAVRFCLRDPDEDVRTAAVQALAARWPDADDGLPSVRAALRDPHATVRRTAAHALAKYWPETADTRVALETAERDPDADVRLAALLGRAAVSGETASIPVRLHEACRDPDPSLRMAALATLVRHEPDAPDTRDAALDATRDPDSGVRRTALDALVDHWAQHPDAVTAVLGAVRDPDSLLRRRAVEAVAGRLGDHPDVPAALAAATHDESSAVRRVGVVALTVRWPDRPESRAALLRARHDPHWYVRQSAMELSAALPAEGATAALRSAACDPNRNVRDTAIALLSSAAARDPAAAALHPDPLLRGRRLHALALGTTNATVLRDAVAGALHATSPSTRFAALAVVGANRHIYPDAEVLPLAEHANRDQNERVRYWALWLLLTRGPASPETNRALRRALTDPDADISLDGLDAVLVGGLPETEARDAALAASQSADSTVRRRAVHALTTRWRDHPATRGHLMTSLRHPDGNVRDSALDALCAVWPEHPGTAVALRRATVDLHDSVRTRAVASASVLLRDDPELVELLRTAARDTSDSVRRAAHAGLRALGAAEPPPNTFTDALAAARDPDPACCVQALWTLATRWPEEPGTRATVERLLHHHGSEVRAMAVRTLTTIGAGDPRTRDTLYALLSANPMAGRSAAAALVAGWPRSPEAAKAGHWSLYVYGCGDQRSIATLSRYQPGHLDGIRRALCRVADAPPDKFSARLVLRSLLISWPTHPETKRVAEAAAGFPDADVRQMAIEARAVLPQDESATAALLDHARGDPDSEVRATARRLTALRDRNERVETATPWHDLTASDPVVRTDAVLRLAQWSDHPDAEPTLGAALGDPHPAVRVAAVQQVACLRARHPATRDRLRAAADDSDAGVRSTALTALAELRPADPRTHGALCRAARDPNPEIRRLAVVALATAWGDDPDTVALLTKNAQDTDDGVQTLAMQALELRGRIGEADHRTVLYDANRRIGSAEIRAWIRSIRLGRTDLTELLSQAGDATAPPAAPSVVAGLATQWCDHPEAAAVLRRAATEGDELGQRLALGALAGMHPHQLSAADMARRARTDPFVEIRDLAVDYLTSQPDQPEPDDAILAACRDDTPRVRRTALDGLVTRWPHLPQTRRAAAAALDDPSLAVASIAATANWQRWRVDRDVRRGMERVAARVDVPSDFTQWWKWVSAAFPAS
ncbi:HEAT repeat protein [Murinocardiopsis flavida]|uniref:HEAT repeat protein n=1 Tax=Murinocardiopsis flavida TaxID=645275 RepID=A0A2P8CAW5_9ACTN|nr:HEAT repeat domain-containing protein [Murinocardiopsis flavida]PSK82114.1 HEAT repeat protein [Murinocardiopsis flavida]